jgi:hypothetical protein
MRSHGFESRMYEIMKNKRSEFLEKAKKEDPYVGRFIEDRLPRYFNDYYILLVTEEHKKEMKPN